MATNDIKVDYEDIITDIQWDLDKARYLLADIQKYFECPDLEYPTREHIETIRNEYKHIAVMIGLLCDLVDKMNGTVLPLM